MLARAMDQGLHRRLEVWGQPAQQPALIGPGRQIHQHQLDPRLGGEHPGRANRGAMGAWPGP